MHKAAKYAMCGCTALHRYVICWRWSMAEARRNVTKWNRENKSFVPSQYSYKSKWMKLDLFTSLWLKWIFGGNFWHFQFSCKQFGICGMVDGVALQLRWLVDFDGIKHKHRHAAKYLHISRMCACVVVECVTMGH